MQQIKFHSLLPLPKVDQNIIPVPYCVYLLKVWAGIKLSINCHKLDASPRKLSAVPASTGCPYGNLVLALPVPAVLTET
jgi:hypothetical protein